MFISSKYVSFQLIPTDVFIVGTLLFSFFFVSDKAPETNKKDLLAEYELMKQLQPHPNVIRLMGAVTLSGLFFTYISYLILTRYLEYTCTSQMTQSST